MTVRQTFKKVPTSAYRTVFRYPVRMIFDSNTFWYEVQVTFLGKNRTSPFMTEIGSLTEFNRMSNRGYPVRKTISAIIAPLAISKQRSKPPILVLLVLGKTCSSRVTTCSSW